MARKTIGEHDEGTVLSSASQASSAPRTAELHVTPPNISHIAIRIIGMAPLMVCRFSQKAMELMMAKHKAGSTGKTKTAKVARDFDADFEGARHLSPEGWDGVHAAAIRNGMISACRLVGFKMTIAKMSLFVEPDGFDIVDGVPLVRIHSPSPPAKCTMHTRNATGVIDLRIRPRWDQWHCDLRLSYDADQFTATDVVNLLSRVGLQVGIGEGRPDSRSSAGMGFGMFRLETAIDQRAVTAVDATAS